MKPICPKCRIRKITQKTRLDMPQDVCWVCGSADFRKALKHRAVEYKGGACVFCGYNKFDAVLQFHHVDPKLKEFRFGNSHSRTWETMKAELDKCILVCPTCHAEQHLS